MEREGGREGGREGTLIDPNTYPGKYLLGCVKLLRIFVTFVRGFVTVVSMK